MKKATILFPHQLFRATEQLSTGIPVYLVEEFLFFKQYRFHKQKLAFHRATMKFYAALLNKQGFEVVYIDSAAEASDCRVLLEKFVASGYETLYLIDPTDDWLEQRIRLFSERIKIVWQESPGFLNTRQELSHFFKPTKKKFFQTSFYKQQRRERNILMRGGEPEGGQWTFDKDNRKPYPKGKKPPKLWFPTPNTYWEEACNYVESHFAENPGTIEEQPLYPTTFEEADNWLQDFFTHRFHDFGVYEDALVEDAHFLNHSVLSPLINVGLLSVQDVLRSALDYAKDNEIPINSLEGFVRQLIGWREFIRGVYEVKGRQERTTNFWNHRRSLPPSFYTGTTGILPIDATIKKVLRTGYAHHIERLMVLANFMVLCEFDPNEVYQWFMELFIDAYDWVMVPNVYGMSLFSDGGIMSTKPYISSSNYLRKMGDYPKGEWEQIWDGLFWNFMDKHRDFFLKNPRLAMLIRSFDKMDSEKREGHLRNAEAFLNSLQSENPDKTAAVQLSAF